MSWRWGVVAALAALAILLAYDRRVAAIFVASAAVVFVVLRLVAMLLMWIARRVPARADGTASRHCQYPSTGRLTPSLVLSLGLGLALLVTVVEIDGNLRREFMAALPDRAPSFFFLDIPAADAERFDVFVHDQRADAEDRARADAARPHRFGKQHQGEDLKPDAGTRWVLQATAASPMRPTFRQARASSKANGGGRLSDPPFVSLENKTAEGSI